MDSTEDAVDNEEQEDTESDSDTEGDTEEIKVGSADMFVDFDELNANDDGLFVESFSKDVDVHIVCDIEEGDKEKLEKKCHTEESLL